MNNGMLRFAGASVALLACGCFAPNNLPSSDSEASEDTSTGPSAGTASTGPSVSSSTTDVTSASTTASTVTGGEPTSSDPTVGADTSSSSTAGEEESSSRTTSGEESGDPTGLLPCSESCTREAPLGWNGPVVRGIGTDACAADYPDVAATAFAGVSGDPADCTCACGAPSGGSCAGTTTVSAYDTSTASNSSGCNSLTETFSIPSNNYIDPNDSGVRFRVAPREVAADPSCTPSSSENVDPSSLNGEIELCYGDVVEGVCGENEVCVPSIGGGFVAGYCIWAEGTQDCPASSGYTAQEVLYTDVIDNRGCSTCSCGDAQNVACGGSVEFTVTYNPVGPVAFTIDPAETVSANDSCSSIRSPNSGVETGNVIYGFSGGVPTLSPSATSCNPQGGSPIGSVSGTQAITVCCVP